MAEIRNYVANTPGRVRLLHNSAEISYRRDRFPPIVIQHTVWPYLRFTLSYRDVEDLLAERGLDISYETARSWVLKFGPVFARRLRRRRPRPSNRWHLDEMVVRIAGERMYLWRAVDHEGEVLDMLVQRRRPIPGSTPPTTDEHSRFVAINGALEVDLTGQVNDETACVGAGIARFVVDSPLEGAGFELSVPRDIGFVSRRRIEGADQ